MFQAILYYPLFFMENILKRLYVKLDINYVFTPNSNQSMSATDNQLQLCKFFVPEFCLCHTSLTYAVKFPVLTI